MEVQASQNLLANMNIVAKHYVEFERDGNDSLTLVSELLQVDVPPKPFDRRTSERCLTRGAHISTMFW